jgi:hypothetical protein
MNITTVLEPRAWTARRWWTFAILILLAHVILVVVFGAKKLKPVHLVTNVPVLKLAPAHDEFMVLNDPTLFAQPQPYDFSAAIRLQTPAVPTNSFRWTEPPRWLTLNPDNLGRTFSRFMQTNQPVTWSLDFKPAPKYSEPEVPALTAPAPASTLRLRGELTGRTLLNPPALNTWPEPDVIAPSKVQVLVNAAGQVISAVLLPPDQGYETATHDDQADQTALNLARAARFAPADQFTVGQMVFNWQVVPAPVVTTPIKP